MSIFSYVNWAFGFPLRKQLFKSLTHFPIELPFLIDWFIILYVFWVQVFHCFNVLQVSSSAPSLPFNPLYGNFWGNGVKFIISFPFTNTISLYYLLIVLKIPLFTFKSKGQMELIIEHRVGQGSISFCFPNNNLFWYFRYAGANHVCWRADLSYTRTFEWTDGHTPNPCVVQE